MLKQLYHDGVSRLIPVKDLVHLPIPRGFGISRPEVPFEVTVSEDIGPWKKGDKITTAAKYLLVKTDDGTERADILEYLKVL